MSFCPTKKCLHYASPAHGGWGVVRLGMLIPQSHQLFICPSACGRHGAIGAIQQGLKNRLSYLYLTQTDIIDGYEDLIIETVKEFILCVSDEIKVILIVVSCIDDLIGTDTISLRDQLNETYPEYVFQICHMNPISGDSKSPPLVTMQKDIYELIPKMEIDKKLILSIGNFESLNDDNDVKQLLKQNGYSLAHISDTQTFEEFKNLGKSSLSLVLAPSGLASAKLLEANIKMPYLFIPISYWLKEIKNQYIEICSILKIEMDDSFHIEKEKWCMDLIEKTKEIIQGKKLIVASSSTNRVFSLALALLKYGFEIDTIFAQSCPSIEEEAKKEIEEKYKNINIRQVLHHTMIQRIPNKRDCISIGIEGAYAVDSFYPVEIEGDHKMYGYQGVELLMKAIIESVKNPRTIQELLDLYKLVI